MKSISIITAPDDLLIDGTRILLYDLTPDQSNMVSNCIKNLNGDGKLLVYMSNHGDDVKWTIDKKQKSSIIIYNADSNNQTMVGYLSAHKNSYYVGELRDLSIINDSYLDENKLKQIMEDIIT